MRLIALSRLSAVVALVIVSALFAIRAAEISAQDDSLVQRLVRVPLIGRTGQMKSARLHKFTGPKPRIEVSSPYVGKIGLGSPEQSFRVAFDTASSDLLIASADCVGCDREASSYSNSNSETYKEVKREVDTHFLKSQGKGFLSTDKLSLGQATVPEQTFVEITRITEPEDVKHSGVDGVFGLGFHWHALNEVVTPVKNMLHENSITRKMVSLYKTDYDSSESVAGEVIFGGVDESKFVGDITYVPVLPFKWFFSIDQLSLNAQAGKIDLCPNGCWVSLNTTSPFTVGPAESVKTLNEALGATKFQDATDYYELPSCETSQLPDLDFTVAGKSFSIKPEDYLINGFSEVEQKRVCLSSFIATSQHSPWIFGDSFIGNTYTVLDYEERQIGFAPLR